MRRFTTGLPLGVVLALAGCAPDPNSGVPQTPCDASPMLNAASGMGPGRLPPPGTEVVAMPRQGVAVTLTRVLYVNEVAAGRASDGTADIQLSLASCSFTPVTLDASLTFLDAGGAAVAQAPAQRVTLPAFGSLGLRFRGSAPGATGFMATVGEAR